MHAAQGAESAQTGSPDDPGRRHEQSILVALRTIPALVADVRAEGFMLPLGERQRERYAVDRRRAALEARVRSHEPGASSELVFHLLAIGPEDRLARLDASTVGQLDARAWAVVAWARFVAAPTLPTLEVLRGAARAAKSFPLGDILLALAELHALGSDGEPHDGHLDAAVVAAFERLVSVDVDVEHDPVAEALALYVRARVYLALPHALDARRRGLLDLQRAVDRAVASRDTIDAAFRARLLGNARLLMASDPIEQGEEAALSALVSAIGSDPSGPIGDRARAVIGLTLERLRGRLVA